MNKLFSSSKIQPAIPPLTTYKLPSTKSGFTIVELLVVIVVIGILAAITIVSYTGISQKATTAALQSDLSNASQQLKIYQVLNSAYPTSLDGSNCFVPTSVDGNSVCLKASSTNTFSYSADNSAASQLFVLTTTKGATTYRVKNDSAPVAVAGISCPVNYIVVPGSATYGTSDFCTMKYGAKNVGGVATSQAALTPWVSIPQTGAGSATAFATAACVTVCHLITEVEYLTIAQNILNVPSNWSTGTVGSGFIYSGHNDSVPANALAADSNDTNGYYGTGNVSPSNQRRTLTLSNGEVIWDLAGNIYEWTSGQTTGGQPGITGEAPGWAWKEWNATPMTPASFSPSGPNPFPSYGTPAASGWNAGTNGIGRLCGYVGDAFLRGFLRGGDWGNGSDAGVLTLLLNWQPSDANTHVGFRVSR